MITMATKVMAAITAMTIHSVFSSSDKASVAPAEKEAKLWKINHGKLTMVC